MEYSLYTMLPKGKHKGQTVEHIINTDIDYITFELYDLVGFSLDDEAFAYYNSKRQERDNKNYDMTWEGFDEYDDNDDIYMN